MKLCSIHIRCLLMAVLLSVSLCAAASEGNTAQCDTLIKQGIDAMWKKDHVKSLELLTRARDMAKKNRWYKQQFLAINNIGANYYTMLDYGEAINYYLESYNIAVKHLEPKFEMVVLNNIAILFSKEKNFDKAREYFKKAYDIARENKDWVKVGLYSMNLGNVANETNKPQEARKYIQEAIPLLKAQPEMLVLAEVALAENDLLMGNARQAREKAEHIYRTTADLNFNDIGLSVTMVITKAYIKEQNYKAAVSTAAKVLREHPNPEAKRAVFELLSEAYYKSKDYAKALAYKDSVIVTDKELNEIKNSLAFDKAKVQFEIQDYKNQIARNDEKRAAERRLYLYSGFGIVAILAIIILILRNISARHKQRKLIAERNQQMTALELEKEKNDHLLLEQQIRERETKLLLEQERLKNEIEARNRKLSAKALYLSGRNQLIEEILQSLSRVPELAEDKTLATHIKTLKSHLKTDEEWDSFITHFEEVNHGVLSRLKALHPTLTANDMRFIAYIYMNLSTKEIASMLNITPEACRKRKERLADKLGLPENVGLYDYLSVTERVEEY
jgi:tetratricopeptide (TPR) repeat protein